MELHQGLILWIDLLYWFMNVTMTNFNSICLFTVSSLKYFMYRFYMMTVVYVKSWLTDFVALSPQANYTNWATAASWRNLVPTFVDRGVLCGQCGRSPMVVNLSFIDHCFYVCIYEFWLVLHHMACWPGWIHGIWNNVKQNILYTFLCSPNSSYMPCPSHPLSFDHSNYTWRRVQVTELLIIQFIHSIIIWIFAENPGSPQFFLPCACS
jgi:hypothetical protein